MKVRYEFANGEVSTVEVSEDIGEVIMESRRAEHSANVRERYHCQSLEDMDYEGEVFADYNTPETEMEQRNRNRKLADAFNRLTPTQQRRLSMLADGMSIRQIAEKEGVDFRAAWNTIELARKSFQKNF